MKGFTKDGKFHPITDYKKVTRKSRDQSTKSKGVKVERKARDKSVKPIGVSWYFGENQGIDYYFTKFGSIKFPNGISKALEQFGAKKVTPRDARELAMQDPDFDFETVQDKFQWDENDSEDFKYLTSYADSKQTDNTYNYSSGLYDTLNYGIFKDAGEDRTFISFSEHHGGDVRGNYGDAVLYEITDIDTGATGEPDGDITEFLAPQVDFTFEYNGNSYDARYDDMNGFDHPEKFEGDTESQGRELWEKHKDELNEQMSKWFEVHGKD